MRGFIRAALVVAFTVIGIGLGPSADVVSALGRLAPREQPGTLKPSCSDSVGQQGGGERVVGGVEGLVLPTSGSYASLTPIRGPNHQRYFVYKAFLAVSPMDAPYAVVSVVRPRSASLYYGSSGEVAKLANARGGAALVTASTKSVRLPVCGRRFTGYVGGIIVATPSTVTFRVSSPNAVTRTVSIAVGTQ